MNRCRAPTANDGAAGVRDTELRLGTVKLIPLLETLLTITTTEPDVAPLGTGTEIAVSAHEIGAAATPLKVTVATL